MKTTIYELLGMIKDGKAPKKIKFNNIYCYYSEYKNEYVDYTNKPIIQWDYVVMNSLNDEVEILETTITYKQDKKIEKLELDEYGNFKRKDGRIHIISPTAKAIIEKIDELIEVINER